MNQPTLDFRTEAIAAIDELIAGGMVQKTIAKTLEKTVASIVEKELSSYSDFGKQLTAAVKKSLAIGDQIDLPTYNDTILKIVARQVESQTNGLIQSQVAERMKDLLQPPPESITLSELVEQFIEHVKEKQHAGCVCYGEVQQITCIVDREDDRSFTYVHLDDEANIEKYHCDISIGIHQDRVFSLRFREGDVEKQLFAGPFYGFERSLFQMKAAGTKIVLDARESEIETAYELAEY